MELFRSNRYVLCLAASVAFFPGYVSAQDSVLKQVVTPADEQVSVKGPEQFFSGDVSVRMLFGPKEQASYSSAYVTFQPGARSNWHTHPVGQHLIVVEGIGLTGTEDGTVVEIRPNDVVWCPPGVKHWHGARADTAMTHMTVTGELDGRNVEWMEPVTDAQYNAHNH